LRFFVSAVASLQSPVTDLQSLRVESLRALLPAPLPTAPGLPTGLAALDRALASGGLPRGRLSEIVGATGKLTLLRPIVEAAARRGEWVTYIDASRTLAPRDWAGIEHLTVIRPPQPAQAAWCADVVLRSAAFALVVLDSAPAISRAVAVRLMGLARESNAALVIVGSSSATKLGGAVRLHTYRRRQRLRISIEKGGLVSGESREGRLQKVVEVRCADGRVARRLCTHSEVPDRRGAARASSSRFGKAGRRAATPAYGGDDRGMLQFC
jgi:hypothetical protein